MYSTIRDIVEFVKELPPRPKGIIAVHSVPYGRSFRQWDTDGHLWVWVNRGEVADLPRSARPDARRGNSFSISTPVYIRHPLWRG